MSGHKAESLTGREREVAGLLARGLTNAEIAERLGITFGTAKWHVSQVLAKTGAGRRSDLGPETQAHGWFALPLAKLLAIVAWSTPAAAVAVAGTVILWQRHAAPEQAGATASQAVATAGVVATPAPATHTCKPSFALPSGSMTPANHSDCDFTGMDFGAIYLNQADLTGATLSGAVFSGATLAGANLSSAVARETKFHSAILQNTNFDRADLTGAEFTDSIVTGATFHDAICPDGLPAANRGNTCLNTPGLRNLPVTRSSARSLDLTGAPASSFGLPDSSTGRLISLADFAGRPVVLWWFASWCGQCATQANELAQAARQYPGLAVLPLSLDANPAAAAAMLSQAGFDGAWVVDSDNVIATNYGVVSVSAAVVVDGQGIYRGLEFAGASGAFTDLLMRAGVIP
jgi:uncharacterized protein YjbI with pentapeptide repeats/DNA-binding CsgD family transcriptional regulator